MQFSVPIVPMLSASALGVLGLFSALPSHAADAQGERNERTLQSFLREMRTAGYLHHDNTEIRAVVERYVTPVYIQHSRKRAPGREGLIADYTAMTAKWPKGKPAPDSGDLYFVAQGDLVVWVSRKPDPSHPGTTSEDLMFQMIRFKDGKLAEHWDSLD